MTSRSPANYTTYHFQRRCLLPRSITVFAGASKHERTSSGGTVLLPNPTGRGIVLALEPLAGHSHSWHKNSSKNGRHSVVHSAQGARHHLVDPSRSGISSRNHRLPLAARLVAEYMAGSDVYKTWDRRHWRSSSAIARGTYPPNGNISSTSPIHRDLCTSQAI